MTYHHTSRNLLNFSIGGQQNISSAKTLDITFSSQLPLEKQLLNSSQLKEKTFGLDFAVTPKTKTTPTTTQISTVA